MAEDPEDTTFVVEMVVEYADQCGHTTLVLRDASENCDRNAGDANHISATVPKTKGIAGNQRGAAVNGIAKKP
jgi:Flp pilus assembly protein CpaB